MVTAMTTYGRAFCWTKRNKTPNTGGVFAVGAKEYDSEHRIGVCCRGNLTDHRRYRSEAIRRCAPRYGRSVLWAIQCASCCASCFLSLSSYCTPEYGARSRTPGREGPTARFLHDGGIDWKKSKPVFTGRGCEHFREEFCFT